MPVKYGFLKYGSPLVAAAPLLVGLNALPTPAYACNGFPDDPPHCANNNGQLITGFENFRTTNLQGIPGATTVPGDTPGSDLYTIDNNAFFTTNDTQSSGSPFNAPNIEGQPQFQRQGSQPEPDNTSRDYIVTDPGYGGGSTVSITIDPVSGLLQVDNGDGKIPGGLQEMIDIVDDDDGPGSSAAGCDLNVNACQAELGIFWVSLEGSIDPDNAARILSAATTAPDDDEGAGLGSDQFSLFGPGSENPAGGGDDDIGDALVDALKDQFGTTVEIRGDGFTNDDDDSAYSDSIISIDNDDDGDPTTGGGIEGDGFNSTDDDDGAAAYSSVNTLNTDDDDGDAIYSSADAIIINQDEDADPTTGGGIGGSGLINTDNNESAAPSEAKDTPSGTVSFAQRQLNSLQKLRDRAANETDPVKKQELEERVQRFENLIQSFGSQAVRVGLHNQDVQTAPLPSRN